MLRRYLSNRQIIYTNIKKFNFPVCRSCDIIFSHIKNITTMKRSVQGLVSRHYL